MHPNEIEKQLARLRNDVDDLKARVIKGGSQTTKAQRQALRDHIEALDKAITKHKQPKSPSKPKINSLVLGGVVDAAKSHLGRTRGKVIYLACKLALPSIKQCDKKACPHPEKNYAWVSWPDQKVFAYHFQELKLLTEDDLKPKIGKELSGKIGPWTYDAEKKLWMKDGDAKEYSQDEFADVIYWETHEEDKEDAADFVKAIMRGTKKVEVPEEEKSK